MVLCAAAAAKQSASLASLSKMTLEDAFPKDAKTQALALAAARGDVAEIDRLVTAGANVNTVGAYGLTVSAWVAGHPNKAGLRRLLELGADPNKLWAVDEKSGRSLVHWAAAYSGLHGLDYLRMVLRIGKGDPNLESGGVKVRPIECALSFNDRAAFLLLYKAGAKINYRTPSDSYGYSVVQKASYTMGQNYLTVLFCLEHGVDYTISGPESAPGAGNAARNLRDNIQYEFKSGWIAGRPEHPQYMWFWRCVDFLEKRGEKFSYATASGRLIQRPKELETTPAEVAMTDPNLMRAAHFDINLTFTAPVWTELSRTDRDAGVRLKRSGNLIEYAYLPQGERPKGEDAAMHVALLHAPGTALAGAVDFAVKRFATAFGQACAYTTVEDAPDHRILRVVAQSGADGYLYVGKYRDTAVAVRQVWKCADAETAAAYQAKALRSMHMVKMQKGYEYIAPCPDAAAQCGPGCAKAQEAAQ
ncbi:ankyrin repeat domain-containing protein [Humidesulfovibrio idahonensis]